MADITRCGAVRMRGVIASSRGSVIACSGWTRSSCACGSRKRSRSSARRSLSRADVEMRASEQVHVERIELSKRPASVALLLYGERLGLRAALRHEELALAAIAESSGDRCGVEFAAVGTVVLLVHRRDLDQRQRAASKSESLGGPGAPPAGVTERSMHVPDFVAPSRSRQSPRCPNPAFTT